MVHFSDVHDVQGSITRADRDFIGIQTIKKSGCTLIFRIVHFRRQSSQFCSAFFKNRRFRGVFCTSSSIGSEDLAVFRVSNVHKVAHFIFLELFFTPFFRGFSCREYADAQELHICTLFLCIMCAAALSAPLSYQPSRRFRPK